MRLNKLAGISPLSYMISLANSVSLFHMCVSLCLELSLIPRDAQYNFFIYPKGSLDSHLRPT